MENSSKSTKWRIFAISLRRSRIRRLSVIAQLFPTSYPFEILDAVDADGLSEGFLAECQAVRSLKAGEIACYLSHINVYERIVDYNLDYGVILEDDFLFQDRSPFSLPALMEMVPEGAAHIQLHNFRMEGGVFSIQEKGDVFHKLDGTGIGTFGYVISKKLAKYVVDNHLLPLSPVDIIFQDLSKSQKGFDFYELREPLVGHRWDLPSLIHS